MNTYHAVQIEADLWAVEWREDGVPINLVWGTFGSQGDALMDALTMARMEYLEAFRSMPRGSDPPHSRDA